MYMHGNKYNQVVYYNNYVHRTQRIVQKNLYNDNIHHCTLVVHSD